MRDKYAAMVILGVVSAVCIMYAVDYAKEVVLLSIGVVASVVRD